MAGRAERGMSAPPEVVFNTATDPSRYSGWLPEPLWRSGRSRPITGAQTLRVRWESNGQAGWSADLRVQAGGAGSTRVCLDITADEPDHRLTELADTSLASLARHVADNLTAG